MDPFEYVLAYLSLLLCRCPSEYLKVAVKPLIYLLMQIIVLLAYLFDCQLLLYGLGLSCGTILISATYIDGVITLESAVPGEDIS